MTSRRPQRVRFWAIQHRPEFPRRPWIVRWVVDGSPHSRTFGTKPQAQRSRARLIVAYDDGERFDTTTGEPVSWLPQGEHTPVYDWARQWLAEQWAELAPRTRDTYAASLARFVPLVVRTDAPERPAGMFPWLQAALKPGAVIDPDDEHERWLRRWGLTLGDLDKALLADVDRRLGLGVKGQRVGATTANRWRKHAKACVRRAVELEKIPTDPWPPAHRGRSRRKANRIAREVDIRRLPDPRGMVAVFHALITRGQPVAALTWLVMSAVAYYAGLRPSEVVMLRRRALHLPYLPCGGWGFIEVVEADDGDDNPTDPKTGHRRVPIPPHLVLLLYAFLAQRPVGPDKLLFRTRNGTRPSLGHWGEALKNACERAGVVRLSPYDLRHACATTMLEAGVPLGEAARRLGHSVQTLVAHYIQALTGDENTANQRIEAALSGAEVASLPRYSRECGRNSTNKAA